LKLEERDKKILIYGGAAAAVILLYAFVFSPLSADLNRKHDLIPRKEQDLAEMKQLKEQYAAMQQRLQEAQAASTRRGPLLSGMESISKRANLSGKIVSLKPQPGVQSEGFQESVVEVRLENVSLYEIVNYVYLLEKDALRIRKLQFKPRYDNPKLLNATVLVSSAG
jgi:type II secretory pathway component PulM